MKFGKEFITQMVPEWEQAYMKYDYLKSLLKDIQGFKQKGNKATPKELTVLPRNHTLYRAFSGLTRSRRRSGSMSPPRDIEEQVILVKDSGGGYETEFFMASDEGGEYELVFFRRLDDEFNKVDKFYQKKVEQVLEEATLLNKQMEAFIAFRIRVDDPEGSIDWSVEMTRLRSDFASSSTGDNQIGSSSSDAHRNSGAHHLDIIKESEQSHQGNSGAEDTDTEGSKKSRNIMVHRPAPLQVLDRVKIHNTLETPYSTIQGVLKKGNHLRLNFKQKELKRIEEQLKQAFVEFYQKLRLLKNYSFLNLMAFSKIMKKYDKFINHNRHLVFICIIVVVVVLLNVLVSLLQITSRNASRSYLKMVDDSYLGNSEEVNRPMERVEVTFIKHFTNGNRSKGIKILRPTPKKERHLVTYSFGFFSGCMTALVVALILIIRARNIIEKDGTTQYMETMFPLYSLFAFIVLHMIMYGLDIYFWRRYRVNYSYIFGFKNGRGLGYIPVLLCSVVLGTFALASVLANLDMEMDKKTEDYKAFTELLPLILVVTVVLVLFCPFNILYRSSRFFLLRTAFHGICAPLYKVTLADFLLADQLTSQVQAFRSFEFYICYYGWNDYKHRKNTCKDKDIYVTFSFLIASIPFWIRFLQCVRRFVEEKDKMQGYNSLKYFSTIVVVCMRTAYSRNHSLGWKITAWTFSGIAAVVSTYWDLVIDWGLLQRHSKNRWLRDKLLVSHKSVYFVAIVLNVLLRFAWVQTVLDFKVSFLHREALIAIVASLEIIRRGMWTFFRLENEHLNNVERYRAFKSVPLPFYYDEDDNKYE